MLLATPPAVATGGISLANVYLLPELVIVVGFGLLLMIFVADFVVLGMVCQKVGRRILNLMKERSFVHGIR
jgi:hypothetical protein